MTPKHIAECSTVHGDLVPAIAPLSLHDQEGCVLDFRANKGVHLHQIAA